MPTSAIKLSVRSLSEEGVFAGCSVVCLTDDASYVVCKSGKCQVLCNNKKKTTNLLSLQDAATLCSHLQTLHANSEEWSHLLSDGCADDAHLPGDDNVADNHLQLNEVNYTVFRTGLWHAVTIWSNLSVKFRLHH